MNENFDELTVPTRAFVTFEHIVTAEMAQDMEFELYEHNIKMQRAQYAGQVIWEDTHHKTCIPKVWKQVLINIGVWILILLYMKFLVWITHMKIEADYIAHPPGAECDSILEQAGYYEPDSVGAKVFAWFEYNKLKEAYI